MMPRRWIFFTLFCVNSVTGQWWAESKTLPTVGKELPQTTSTPESSTNLAKLLATAKPVELKTKMPVDSSSVPSSTTEKLLPKVSEEKPTELPTEKVTETSPSSTQPSTTVNIRAEIREKTTEIEKVTSTEPSTTKEATTLVQITDETTKINQPSTTISEEIVSSTTEKEVIRQSPVAPIDASPSTTSESPSISTGIPTLIPQFKSTEPPAESTTVEVFSKMLKPDLATIYRRLFNLKPFRQPGQN